MAVGGEHGSVPCGQSGYVRFGRNEFTGTEYVIRFRCMTMEGPRGQVLFCHIVRRRLPLCPVHFALSLLARCIT